MYNRDSKIMRKLLGKAAPDSPTGESSSISGTTTPIPSSVRPPKSLDAGYNAGAPISCFDVSADRRAVILAGPHILKIVVVNDPASRSFRFKKNIIDVRRGLTSQQSSSSHPNIVADQLNIRDVKWHNGSHIYTACASGKVFSYDLTRLAAGEPQALRYTLMSEDSRQVNSLDINPHLQSWLLTGGQDGTARIFDSTNKFEARYGLSFRQRFAPLRCIDPIRRVSWSPTQGHEMACCTESGVVMKWDVRQPGRPLLRLNAHDKSCSSIAWHPDGIHLLSAGWDTKVHVWDLGPTADKRQKPKFTISAPASVAAASWRPGLWSATAQAKRVAQVAVTYDETSSRKYGTPTVHVWDLARPLMPYKEMETFEACPSAIWWRDQDLLWTVGPDGAFTQRDVSFAHKATDRQSTSAMAFSPRGDALLLLDERPNSNRLRYHGTEAARMISRASYGSSPSNPGALILNQSDSEDEVLSSFLGARRSTIPKKAPSGRGSVSLSTTPPSGEAPIADDAKQTLGLEQSINITGTFKSQQTMLIGPLPAALPVQFYQSMSNAYMDALYRGLPYVDGGKSMVERVEDIMEQFAKASEAANLYRMAQTWRILGYAMGLLLRRRAQHHFEIRTGQLQKMHLEDGPRGSDRMKSLETNGDGEDTPRHGPTKTRSLGDSVHSLLDEKMGGSRVSTPVMRPADSCDSSSSSSSDDDDDIDDTRNDYAHDANNANLPVESSGQQEESHAQGHKLLLEEPDSLSLGPAAHGSFNESNSLRKRSDLESVAPPDTGGREEEPDVSPPKEGKESYDTGAAAKAIDLPMTEKRTNGDEIAHSHRDETAGPDSDEGLGQIFSESSRSTMSSRTEASGDPGEGLKAERESTSGSQGSPVISIRVTDEKALLEEMAENKVSSSKQLTEIVSHTSDDKKVPLVPKAPQADDGEGHPRRPLVISQDPNGIDPSTLSRIAIPGIDTGRPTDSKVKETTSPRHDPRPRIVETDYLPWSDDSPHADALWAEDEDEDEDDENDAGAGLLSFMTPLDPYTLLTSALDNECRTSALHASAMILLLKPLVPESIINSHRARAILQQHYQRLMQMSLFVEAAFLRQMCLRGWPEGLPDWGDNYECIFSRAQQAGKFGLSCSTCRKPREIDPQAGPAAVWICERCRSIMAPCSVCGHREIKRPSHIPAEVAPRAGDVESVESDKWLSEWWFCPECGHGGHASCLHLWHGTCEGTLLGDGNIKYSDGFCPSDGCGHACLSGPSRGGRTTMRGARGVMPGRAVGGDSIRVREQGNNRAGSSIGRGGSRGSTGGLSPGGARLDGGVRGNGVDVPQSGTRVTGGMTRDGFSRGSGGGIRGGILSASASPGGRSSSGDKERRKSVKFARQDHGS
ncbi:hypothetical protein E4U52_001748 [Claviceps spartinae]|nr:hypothetical protein E4U52_001748 [Claviceps spartinae]